MDTHDRILAYLHENRTATVPGLSKLWGITRPDIRHHIQNLVLEGFVEAVPRRETGSARRGRPEIAYRLRSASGASNYQNLAASLLTLLFRDRSGKIADDLLADLAQELVEAPVAGTTLTQKLNRVVQWLNEREYHSRWEATAEGPRLMFLHCPYASLVADHPELCKVDRLVLEKILGRKLHQTAKMDWSDNCSRACIFTIPYFVDQP